MPKDRLSDIGERRLVTEILRERYGEANPQFGDDVAIALSLGDATVVVTTDPAPQPVSWQLGIGDFYDWGWLLSAINLSDLAAAGATPMSMVTSLTLPALTSVTDFLRLYDGIDDCNAANQSSVVGGNLKESDSPVAEATAIGLVIGAAPNSRSGAQPGDFAIAFGPTGMFRAAVLAKRRGLVLTAPSGTRF